MWEQIELSRGVRVGRHPPTDADLAALRRDGVRAVIDVRTDTEPYDASLPPAEEAVIARAYGLEAIHVPIDSAAVTKADLDRVGQALRDAPKPVLIHCAVGKRAGMVALVHTAIETGTPGAETLEMARNLDLVFGSPAQQRLFADYVDEHERPPDSLIRREEALRVDGRPVPLLPEAVREFTQEVQGKNRRRATPAWMPLRGKTPAARLRVPVPGVARPLSGRSLGVMAAAGAVLLLLDRRLRIPLLIAAAIVGGRAIAVLQSRPPAPPTPPPPEDPTLDLSIAELDARIRRLKATA